MRIVCEIQSHYDFDPAHNSSLLTNTGSGNLIPQKNLSVELYHAANEDLLTSAVDKAETESCGIMPHGCEFCYRGAVNLT